MHGRIACPFLGEAVGSPSQMAEYLEWPRGQMAFAHDESLQTEGPICNSNSVRLQDDGSIHFFALFTINRFDNVNHRYQLIFPIKVKKLEDSFLLTITGLVEEVLLGTKVGCLKSASRAQFS